MDYFVWFLIALVIALAFALVKSSSIQIPELLEWREKRKREKFQENCPHGRVEVQTEPFQIYVESWFHTVPGTIMYFCKRCSLEVFEAQADFVRDEMAKDAIRIASKKTNIPESSWRITNR